MWKRTLLLASILLLILAAGLTIGYRWQQQRQQQALLDAMPEIGAQIVAQIRAQLNGPPYGGFVLDLHASVSGDVTTLELTFRNTAQHRLQNLDSHFIRLGQEAGKSPLHPSAHTDGQRRLPLQDTQQPVTSAPSVLGASEGKTESGKQIP